MRTEDQNTARDNNQFTFEDAMRRVRQDYWEDVRDMADSIKSELEDQIKDGVRGEDLREWLIEHIDESVDGSARVIYTQSAQICLLCSDNDGAYEQEFGSEGMVENGTIMWSRLAYAAFRADVIEQLDAIGVDVNDPDADVEDEDEDESEEDAE